MGRLLAGTAVLWAFGGCRALSPKPKLAEPFASSQGAIVGSIVMRGHEFPNVIPHSAEEVFFAQVSANGAVDADHPVSSNHYADGLIYLLNIPPGRYVPLTSSYYHRGVRYQGRLTPEEAKLWAVDVRPGEIAFFGANTLRTEWQGLGKGILDFFKQILAHIPPFPRPTTRIEISTPRTDRAPQTEAHALRQAREELKGTLWIEAVDRRLTVLGNPPETLTTGLIFKKPKPKLGEGAFKYVETLGWGDPKPAPGGLRWLEPKNRAEILVAYLQRGVEGYKPREAYLEDMRTAGTDEDAHMLSEITISSRTAKMVQYTTYVTPPGALVGSRAKAFRTETLLVPAADGFYLLRYRAERGAFADFFAVFRKFIQYVEYEVPLEKKRPVDEF